MEEELEVELDAYKDFDELKPWWCEGSLQERTDKNGSTKFYVNFGRTCGCEATKKRHFPPEPLCTSASALFWGGQALAWS